MLDAKTDVKIVLLGDSGVGKSSIMLRYVADNFSEGGEPNVGASYMSKQIQIGDLSIKFNIWDTAGQERFHNLAKIYYRNADAAILVYDITSRMSFEGIKRWHDELQKNGPSNIVKIIAANKEDLVDYEEVAITEALEFSQIIGCVVKSTSAKTSYGVTELFSEIIREIYPGIIYSTIKKRPQSLRLDKDKMKSKKKNCCLSKI